MHIRRIGTLLFILFIITVALPVAAEDDPFATDWRWTVHDARDKLIDLAEAIPADKYGWRPADGVRSVSEVLMHVALGNFFIPGALGIDPPTDVPTDGEKTVTTKDEVIALLKRSFDHVDRIDLDSSKHDELVQLFGNEWPRRRVLLLLMAHHHEHLGQMIAYARSNDVVPPWSR